jgi:hypothetical protein
MVYSLIIEPITGINANLDLIAKYHNGTKILLNPNQENKVKTQVCKEHRSNLIAT